MPKSRDSQLDIYIGALMRRAESSITQKADARRELNIESLAKPLEEKILTELKRYYTRLSKRQREMDNYPLYPLTETPHTKIFIFDDIETTLPELQKDYVEALVRNYIVHNHKGAHYDFRMYYEGMVESYRHALTHAYREAGVKDGMAGQYTRNLEFFTRAQIDQLKANAKGR